MKYLLLAIISMFSLSVFAGTERHDVIEGSAAVGNNVTTFPIIPNGKTVRVRKFGGFDPDIGDNKCGFITLQWGNGGGWETIRAGGCGSFEFVLLRDFVGDGVKRHRIIRTNNSVSAKDMVAWAESLVFD